MIDVLFPIGRLVQGSLYKLHTTDMEGRPLTYKSGHRAGQPRSQCFFAVAIKKAEDAAGNIVPWNQTPWGQKIVAEALKEFPNGQTNAPTFAWKIIDGDSTIPNTGVNAMRPCDRQGHPGHWIVKFTIDRLLSIHRSTGRPKDLEVVKEQNAVNLGDYVQVYANVKGNNTATKPGLFISPVHLYFAGFGERIEIGVAADAVGFGGELPEGASSVPVQGMPPISLDPVAQPYPEILKGPAEPIMTATAQGTYEQYKAAGWTDELLRARGYMI